MHLSAQPPCRPYMLYLLLWGLTYSTVITCDGYYSLCWRVGVLACWRADAERGK